MQYDLGVSHVVAFTSLPSPNDERGFEIAIKMQEVVPTVCVCSERFFACGGRDLLHISIHSFQSRAAGD